VPVLLIGGFLFLLAIIGVGIFVVLPMLDEKPSYPGYEDTTSAGSGLSGDMADGDPYGEEAGSAGSPVRETGTVALTPVVTPVQPTRVSSSIPATTPSPADPVIGMWDLGSTGMQVQFSADGTATLTSPATGSHSTGSWERASEGHYRLRSASGTMSPDLVYDPLAGLMHTTDYSAVFIRRS
jgi:hypothetical protein